MSDLDRITLLKQIAEAKTEYQRSAAPYLAALNQWVKSDLPDTEAPSPPVELSPTAQLIHQLEDELLILDPTANAPRVEEWYREAMFDLGIRREAIRDRRLQAILGTPGQAASEGQPEVGNGTSGRPRDTAIQRRRELVGQHMRSKKDFKDETKVQKLFAVLDQAAIPLPRRDGSVERPSTWCAAKAIKPKLLETLKKDLSRRGQK